MGLNPFPNKPWFLRVCSTSLLKTLWEKEKLLVTSKFSFSHNVFYTFGKLSYLFIKFEIVVWKLFHIRRVQNLLFGKGLRVTPISGAGLESLQRIIKVVSKITIMENDWVIVPAVRSVKIRRQH